MYAWVVMTLVVQHLRKADVVIRLHHVSKYLRKIVIKVPLVVLIGGAHGLLHLNLIVVFSTSVNTSSSLNKKKVVTLIKYKLQFLKVV